ncbi:MAG: ankyrin repeat domain-containing protein, partial [Alphaproteobacteria bacterium]
NKIFDKLKPVVDINARNNEGLTALNAAIKKGIYDTSYVCHGMEHDVSASREKYIEKLLEAGADFTIPDNNLKTPLHYAAQKALVDIVVDLVECGADVCAVDKDGLKPSDYAKNKIIRAYLKMAEEQQPKRVTSYSNHMSVAQKGHENTHA